MKKLFCIPYAGGSANIYSSWRKWLDNDIELIPIELAGRGSRCGESFYTCWESATSDLYTQITAQIQPGDIYGIYGHSMGSWLAYEVLKKICVTDLEQPHEMFFSGNTPPFLEPKEDKISHLPDREFIQKIVDMGDTPLEIFDDAVIDYFLPPLRNDYILVEHYRHDYQDINYFGNIHAYFGKDDVLAPGEIEKWCSYHHRNFEIQGFESGHMFIKDCKREVVEKINRAFEKEKDEERSSSNIK